MKRGGSRRVAKFLQKSTLIALDLIWKVLLSDRNFATLLVPPLYFSIVIDPLIDLLIDSNCSYWRDIYCGFFANLRLLDSVSVVLRRSTVRNPVFTKSCPMSEFCQVTVITS